MNKFVYAKIKNPENRNLREEIYPKYRRLWNLTNQGETPLRFKIKENGKLKYDDMLADIIGMKGVLTRKQRVNIVPSIIKKQIVFPF